MAVKHTFRWRDKERTESLTPVKAKRMRCMDCSCWQQTEVRECPARLCPLWPYRMGKRAKAYPLYAKNP